MICAKFFCKDGRPFGFSISGHADYSDCGEDIVCAAVTSAVQLTANGITEILNVNCKLNVSENEISLMLSDGADDGALSFVESLRLHMSVLSEDYPDNVGLEFLEV